MSSLIAALLILAVIDAVRLTARMAERFWPRQEEGEQAPDECRMDRAPK